MDEVITKIDPEMEPEDGIRVDHRSAMAQEQFQKPPRSGRRGMPRKLSELEVRDIMKDPRLYREIAAEYEISISLVWQIKNHEASYFEDHADKFGFNWRAPQHRDERLPNSDLYAAKVRKNDPGHPPKLDEEDVQKILRDPRTLKVIALEMGISISTVSRVKNHQYQGRSKNFRPFDEVVGASGHNSVYATDPRTQVRKPRG